tara:strand:- start:1111 stop:1977 length:867 start_codon:yes stop_codon:yes gene_type:complete
MSNDIFFISDFFKKDLSRAGAENNDFVLLKELRKKYDITTKHSHLLDNIFLKEHADKIFIFSNFVNVQKDVLDYCVASKIKYIIYEHDHKYVSTRDPSPFRNFIIPQEYLINTSFYKHAKTVVCLSQICKEILETNLNIKHVHSIGCSLWLEETYDMLEELAQNKKTKQHAVLNSQNKIKGTEQAIAYCKKNNITYENISSDNHREFLKKLSTYETLIFIPQVLETFSRLAIEAKCLNCRLITKPKLLGCSSEKIFNMSGPDLVQELRIRKNNATKLFERLIEECKSI